VEGLPIGKDLPELPNFFRPNWLQVKYFDHKVRNCLKQSHSVMRCTKFTRGVLFCLSDRSMQDVAAGMPYTALPSSRSNALTQGFADGSEVNALRRTLRTTPFSHMFENANLLNFPYAGFSAAAARGFAHLFPALRTQLGVNGRTGYGYGNGNGHSFASGSNHQANSMWLSNSSVTFAPFDNVLSGPARPLRIRSRDPKQRAAEMDLYDRSRFAGPEQHAATALSMIVSSSMDAMYNQARAQADVFGFDGSPLPLSSTTSMGSGAYQSRRAGSSAGGPSARGATLPLPNTASIAGDVAVASTGSRAGRSQLSKALQAAGVTKGDAGDHVSGGGGGSAMAVSQASSSDATPSSPAVVNTGTEHSVGDTKQAGQHALIRSGSAQDVKR